MSDAGVIRVLHTLPDLALGGGQQLLLRNIAGMERSGFEHHVLAVHGPMDMAERFRAAGCVVHGPLASSGRGLPRAAWRARALIRDRGIDIVHTNNTGADRRVGQLAALLASRPAINSIHAEAGPMPRSPAGRVRDAFDGWLTRRTLRRVVAVSAGALETWREWLDHHAIPVTARHVIRPGLDVSRFGAGRDSPEVREARRELGLGEAAWPVLINVARFVPGKGQRFLAAMMRRVREAHAGAALLLVGGGPDEGGLRALCEREGVGASVRLVGERADVPALLAAADLFVFPSLSEGFGLAPLEAMAAGLAVVAFDLPALREFIEPGGSGELARHSDGDDLAASVLSLLKDRGAMRSMGQRGREIVESRFRQDAVSAAWAALYRGVREEWGRR